MKGCLSQRLEVGSQTSLSAEVYIVIEFFSTASPSFGEVKPCLKILRILNTINRIQCKRNLNHAEIIKGLINLRISTLKMLTIETMHLQQLIVA